VRTLISDWQMPRPGRNCTACTRAFEADEVFAARLYETPGGYERRDYCQSCTPAAEPGLVGAWKARRTAPTTKSAAPFDREVIYRFFLRLEGDERPAQVQFRFLLALLLWRKKVLKFMRAVTVADREQWEFGAAGAEETHRVVHPELDEAELERLSGQLEQLLTGGPDVLELPAVVEERADG